MDILNLFSSINAMISSRISLTGLGAAPSFSRRRIARSSSLLVDRPTRSLKHDQIKCLNSGFVQSLMGI